MADTLMPSIPSQQRVPVRSSKPKLTILIKPFSSFTGLGPGLMAATAEPSESMGTLVIDEDWGSDTTLWPPPSPRGTTAASAIALERATGPDHQPRLPELVVDDDLGI